MDNLIKNSFYYFRVFAENSIGLSEPLETEQVIEAKPAFGNYLYFFIKKEFHFIKNITNSLL